MKKIIESPLFKIGLAAVVLLLGVVGLWFSMKSKTDLAKNDKDYKLFAHTEDGIIKDEVYNGLEISNITFISTNGYSTFTANVVNNGDKENDFETIHINLLDESGATVISLLGSVGKIKPGESTVLSASAKGEFKNVVSKTISE